MISEICFEEPLLKSAQSVFETMIFMDIAESCDPALIKDNPPAILGSITFKGSIEGCLSISCSQACSREIAMNMLGMEPDEQISDEEISDAIGEVSNMVMGSLKTLLDDGSIQIEVSIPTVIKGSELEGCLRDNSERVVLQACLEDTYPVSIVLHYRMVSSQDNN